MRRWRDVLETKGHLVVSRWIEGNHEISEAQASLSADHADDECRRFAQEDVDDLIDADVFLSLSDPANFRTGRGGRHVELGLALAWGKPVILVGERENVFHWLPQVKVVPGFIDAVNLLSGKGGQGYARRKGDETVSGRSG